MRESSRSARQIQMDDSDNSSIMTTNPTSMDTSAVNMTGFVKGSEQAGWEIAEINGTMSEK